jgi:hypothetical protein
VATIFSIQTTTNQKMALAIGGGIGDGMRPWRNVSGGNFGIVWGGKLVDKKVETFISHGLRWPPNNK